MVHHGDHRKSHLCWHLLKSMITFLDSEHLPRCVIRVLCVISFFSVFSVLNLFSSELSGAVRIGVLGLFRPGELTVRPASHSVLVIKSDGQGIVLQDGKEAHLRIASRQVECRSGEYSFTASVIRGEGRQGGPAEFILSVPGRISREYRGSLEVGARDGKLLPVVTVDLEVAVASAVAAESPPSAPPEALKAQAVVTRSYYLAGSRHAGFDFCDTTHCQFLREPPPADSPALMATAGTRGLVLTYREEVIHALFSASCGGRTRSLAEAGLNPQGYPYYPVICEYCLRYAPRWNTTLDPENARFLLSGPPTEARRLRINRKLGWSTIPGNNYALEEAGECVIIRGNGQGHGIGLCQLGASGMAAQGSTFLEILNHYYPNSSHDWRDK